MPTPRCAPSCCTAPDATSSPARTCASSIARRWRPLLYEVLRRVEACSKPVIAALHGATLGGGAECALASHYRCASRDLQFGLPEVKVGLLPGAGGTVRLPRLVGVKQALDMMTSGDPIGLARAIELGIVDKAVGDDVRTEAIAWAAELAAAGAPVRRLRDASIPDAGDATPAWFAQYREALPRAARKLPATERIVQCVEAAVNLPFDAAMSKARELFEPCRTSAESRSLRHLFFAERGAPVQGEIRPVAQRGRDRLGHDGRRHRDQPRDRRLLGDAHRRQRDRARGRPAACPYDDRCVREEGPPDRRCGGAGHRSRERQRRFRGARERRSRDRGGVREDVRQAGSLRASSARSASPARCSPRTRRRSTSTRLRRRAGARRTSSACTSSAPRTSCGSSRSCAAARPRDAALATAAAVTKRIGKLGVIVGNCFGFVGNRMLYAYGREKELMLLEGASPEQIDRAMQEFGMAMGPERRGRPRRSRHRRERAARSGAASPTTRATTASRTCWPSAAATARRPVPASTVTKARDKKRTTDPEVAALITRGGRAARRRPALDRG